MIIEKKLWIYPQVIILRKKELEEKNLGDPTDLDNSRDVLFYNCKLKLKSAQHTKIILSSNKKRRYMKL